jgi:hypothetical protein
VTQAPLVQLDLLGHKDSQDLLAAHPDPQDPQGLLDQERLGPLVLPEHHPHSQVPQALLAELAQLVIQVPWAFKACKARLECKV